MNVKEFVLDKIALQSKKHSLGNVIKLESESYDWHRSAVFTIENSSMEGDADFCVRSTRGGVCVGVLIKVSEQPELALAQFVSNDDPWCGCPHHYELSEDRQEVLYVRHGTSCLTETEGRYIEERYESLFLEAELKLEELRALPKTVSDSYNESFISAIMMAFDASKALSY